MKKSKKDEASELMMTSMLELAKSFEGFPHPPEPRKASSEVKDARGLGTRRPHLMMGKAETVKLEDPVKESFDASDAMRYLTEALEEDMFGGFAAKDAGYTNTRKLKNALIDAIRKAKRAGDKTSVGQDWQALVHPDFAIKIICENECKVSKSKIGTDIFHVPMQADASDFSIDFDLLCVIDRSTAAIKKADKFKIVPTKPRPEEEPPVAKEKDERFTDLLRDL
jgi:hypothetical protein